MTAGRVDYAIVESYACKLHDNPQMGATILLILDALERAWAREDALEAAIATGDAGPEWRATQAIIMAARARRGIV